MAMVLKEVVKSRLGTGHAVCWTLANVRLPLTAATSRSRLGSERSGKNMALCCAFEFVSHATHSTRVNCAERRMKITFFSKGCRFLTQLLRCSHTTLEQPSVTQAACPYLERRNLQMPTALCKRRFDWWFLTTAKTSIGLPGQICLGAVVKK